MTAQSAIEVMPFAAAFKKESAQGFDCKLIIKILRHGQTCICRFGRILLDELSDGFNHLGYGHTV